MLDYVEIQNEQGHILTLPLQDIDSGIIIESIEGLDPVKATLTGSSFAQIDGEQYQSGRRDKREIIFNLALDSDYSTSSVQDLRNTLYSYFMPKTAVIMRFFSTDLETLVINGYVEDFNAPKFVKDPVASISILCFNPDFVGSTIELSGTTADFFETPGTTFNINYIGTVDTGVKFVFDVDPSLLNLTITHVLPNGDQKEFSYFGFDPFMAGDQLVINSSPGEKQVARIRGGSEQSQLFYKTATSTWITLRPGLNVIDAYSTTTPSPYTLTYTNKFGAM